MTRKRIYPEDVFVGERIKLHRLAKDMTQTTLAEGIGIAFQQVQKYENGKTRISVGRLMRIAELLGVPLVDFLPSSGIPTGKDVDPLHTLGQTTRGQRLAQAYNDI